MTEGFVFKWRGEEEDSLRIAYNTIKDQCFSEKTFWFGWNETSLVLPRPFDQRALNPDWDVVRIFSPHAELRAQWRGPKKVVLLLTEDTELVDALRQMQVFELVQKFFAEPGHRVLVGTPPKTPVPGVSPSALIEIAFPTALDYGIPANPGQMLVAEVQLYFDNAHRLYLTRYCTIRAENIGAREVRPYVWPTDTI
jgi:hypothetical protein